MLRICILIFLLLIPALSCGADLVPRLQGLSKEEGLASTRIVLELNWVPRYRVKTSGQRVDLFLGGAEAGSSLRLPEEDDRIVKVLLAGSSDELMVSFLLRRPPTRVLTETVHDRERLILDLFWDEDQSRPAIAFRVPGLPALQRNGAVLSPDLHSPYDGKWEAFFREFRVPVTIRVPLYFSLPPRPASGEAPEEGLAATLEKLAASGDWPEVAQTLDLLEHPPVGSRESLLLQAMRAEALVRGGGMGRALPLLEALVRESLPAELAERVGYLHALALAATGDPHQGRFRLDQVLKTMNADSLYAAHARLLQAEIDLATEKPKEALAVLQGEQTPWPALLKEMKNLRTADALCALGKPEEALRIYRGEDGLPRLLAAHPYSLYRCALAHAMGGDGERAGFLFGELSKIIPEGPDRGLAWFAAGQAWHEAGKTREALTYWMQVQTESSGSEGDFRARMGMLDQDVLSGDELRRRIAAGGYAEVAAGAPLRELREEAAFKRALTFHLLGEDSACVDALAEFRRDFAAGGLQHQADFLLRRIIPGVVTRMIAAGEDLKALVLVEQNRDALLTGAVDLDFLLDVAMAARHIGLFERACRVYLYILDGPGDPRGKESFYLPLIELAYEGGEADIIFQYAPRYLEHFPQGESRERIFLLLLRSLREEGRLEKAAELIAAPRRPRSGEIDLLSAEILWAMGDYRGVTDCLQSAGEVLPRAGLLQAEAYCRLQQPERALPIYRGLMGVDGIGEQAAYRSAEIHLSAGRREAGLKILRDLVEKGKDPLWQRLAGETLAAAPLFGTE